MVRSTLIVASLFFASSIASADSTLYHGGKIYTVDPTTPWASEILVTDGKIACVGKKDECANNNAASVDLGGKFMMPGVVDSHNHIRYATGTKFLSIWANDLAEFRDQINDHAVKFPELEWIQGDGWNYSIFKGGMPTYRDLEGLADGKPMILTSYDAHTQLLNKAAMDAFGITKDTKRTPLGTMMRDMNGEPTGVFKAALYISEEDQNALYSILPAPDEEDMYQSFLGNLEEAAASGITTVVEPQNYPEDIAFFERARREGKLNAYIHLALYYTPEVDAETLAEYKRIRDKYADDPQIKVPAIKLYIDDVIESETAALFEPYMGSETNKGELFYKPATFNDLVTMLDAEKFQLFIHAIGDRGIHTALNALEAAREANGKPERPHQIVHIELLWPPDVERFAKLDISAAIQPRHMSPDISVQWARSIGAKRLANAWPLKSMKEAGARFAFSSDWNVAEMNPMTGIYSAVTRQGLSGNPKGGWVPEQKIDVATAIHGYTLGGAISNGLGGTRGSLQTGKYADMIVLSDNPFDVTPNALKDIQILQTIFQGKTVFKAQ